MVSRVCIITNYRDTGNYGAILQAYALNKKINKMGVLCETLNFSLREQNASKIGQYAKRIKKREFNALFQDIKRDACKLVIKDKIITRKRSLVNFKNNIPHTRYYRSDQLSQINSQYDCFICGSDQIWHPIFEGSLVGIFWLDVIESHRVKASYAASMGVPTLPNDVVDEAKSYLKEFDFISVRERSIKGYLSQLTEKEIVVSVDPVFLLKRDEWQLIAKQPAVKNPFVFVYMIHGSKQLLGSIAKFAKSHNYDIITFPYMSNYFRLMEFNFGDVKIFDAEPSEFLGYIEKAEYVFTDSFHGTAFSIIFHKKFFSSSNSGHGFSRIENILTLFGLSERKIPAVGLNWADYDKIDMVDWNAVDEKINAEITESTKYLYSVLDKTKE